MSDTGVQVLGGLRVPMRDRILLVADVYLPKNVAGPLPVILERTPYGRRGTNAADRTLTDPVPRSKPEVAARFARAGYAYMIQDCRGRFDSQGNFVKYTAEAEDGADTVAWLLDQPWCNGRVATVGLSYCAHAQAALAALNPAGLAAMFLDSGGFSSAFHSGIRQGGALELKQLTWAMKHARLAASTLTDSARGTALAMQDIADWIGVNPWQRGSSPLLAAPEYEEFVVSQWERECLDDFWRQPSLSVRHNSAGFADVPMVFMASWYDPYARSAVENYIALSHMKRGPVHLVMGPWTHGQRSVSHAGDVDFGPAASLDGNLAPDYDTLRRAWLDRYVRDLPAPDYLGAPVNLFVMGGGSGRRTKGRRLDHGGSWRRACDWPLPEAIDTLWYANEEGGLTDYAPAKSGQLSFPADPDAPVPTIGGAIASGAPLMSAGAFDQRESASVFGATCLGRALSERDDVLIFETEPLIRDLTVIGTPVARLWVSASTRDADVMVKLVDVHPCSEDYPHGFAMNLAHGILRLRFHLGFERCNLLEPGCIYPITIPLFPTANRFLQGHRLRIEVAGSNFPHFEVNSNTGAPAGTCSEPVVARTTIHMTPECPSHFVMPTVPHELPPTA